MTKSMAVVIWVTAAAVILFALLTLFAFMPSALVTEIIVNRLHIKPF